MRLAAKPSVYALEVLVWALLSYLGATGMRVYRPMPLTNDGYQYLSVAEHVKHDHQATTSLVHFDVERSHGRIPAPLTNMPPGYPVAIAFISFSGNFESAARVLSGVCYAGTAALLAWALILTGVGALLRQFALLLFATNAVALAYATSVLTEPLYLLLSIGALVGLIWAEGSALPKRLIVVGAVSAFAAAGLAYWVRYAGLFLIVAVIGYALLRLLLPGTRFRGVFLLSVLIPVALAAAMMLRNAISVGTWMGGNNMAVQTPLKVVMSEYAKAQLHLILGLHAVTFGVWESLLLAGGFGILTLFITAVWKGGVRVPGSGWTRERRRPDASALLVGLCLLVHSAGMIYAGWRTAITFDTRMFLPVLPLYLLALGMGANWLTSRWAATGRSVWLKAGLLTIVVAYAGINARDLYEAPVTARYEILAAQYAMPAADGRPLREWVESHVPAGDVIVAADGQATGYLLHRPTLSMINAQFSPVRWECEEVKAQMGRFKSNYVFLYKPSSTAHQDPLLLDESRFVATSVLGQPPCGFVIAAENADIRILTSARN